MSTEDRLARLGLLHLKDKPEELARALKEQSESYDAEVAAWQVERERLMKERASARQRFSVMAVDALERLVGELGAAAKADPASPAAREHVWAQEVLAERKPGR